MTRDPSARARGEGGRRPDEGQRQSRHASEATQSRSKCFDHCSTCLWIASSGSPDAARTPHVAGHRAPRAAARQDHAVGPLRAGNKFIDRVYELTARRPDADPISE